MSLWLTHPLFLPSLIVGVTIVLWATSLLPEFITALLFFAAAMMAKIAPPEVIFGGFASSAFWLVFSGFVLGIAIRKTGLADRAGAGAVGQAHRLLAADGRQRGTPELRPGVRDALQHGAHRAADADRGGDGPPRGHCRR
ncbi:di- and tricarboxylate transporter [Klebsiella pneumoniae]|uniref:Di- and tricarboxylate transporter n=1 Tax=Klebsiella pneumoniae TaxID=573 RepID=A0A377YSZ7_KLEPN|nr:di- and tricarboxylate transporter [Klebsiella pneumoniae]